MLDKRITGPLAEAKVIARLIENGFNVFTQFSGKEPFDVVAYKNHRIYRVQVKSTQYKKNGSWLVILKTSYLSSKGVKIKFFDKRDCDVLAVYIVEMDKICFIKTDNMKQKTQLNIRSKFSDKSRSNLLIEETDGMGAFD